MTFSVTRRRVTNINLLVYANKCRNEGFFNDVTIFAGNEMIPANRLVLSCQSKYFEGMFRLTHQNVIEIKAVDGTTIKALIDFIYTGSITIDDRNVESLQLGAEYFKINEVEQFCDEFMLEKSKLHDSFALIKAASLNKKVEMKDDIREYVSTHLEELTQTDKFKSLSKVEMIFFISNLELSRARKTSIYQAVITWVRHNEETLKTEFFELFRMINLSEIDKDFIKNTILKERLVETNVECQYQAISALHSPVINKPSLPRESHLIRLGGHKERKKVNVVFRLSQDTHREYANFDVGLHAYCSLMLNDHIYTMGGLHKRGDDLYPTNEVVKLNLKDENAKWEKVVSMNKGRYLMSASVYRGTLFVAGGRDQNYNSLVSCEYYLPENNKWKYAPPLIQSRDAHALVSCDECLYALGGWSSDDFEFLSSAEKLTHLDGEWQNIQTMQTPRRWFAAVNCNGVVYAIGGQSGEEDSTTLKSVEKYDCAENQWKYVSDMNTARSSHTACVMRGKIYVVGGSNTDKNFINEVECYDPVNDAWSIVGNTINIWNHHTLVAY